VVESSVVGLRKPDPKIYKLACERLSVKPAETVFLDDLGPNLVPAKKLGIYTIQVREL
jgi:putative hydrolase of the HAD superfamily